MITMYIIKESLSLSYNISWEFVSCTINTLSLKLNITNIKENFSL
jgi:hypothetical protein